MYIGIEYTVTQASGKTTLMYQIQQHLMFTHHERIAAFNLEEKATGALNGDFQSGAADEQAKPARQACKIITEVL